MPVGSALLAVPALILTTIATSLLDLILEPFGLSSFDL
ncbi:hypothetical protein NNO_1672 [Hydrogenimonas sp.]|nr:hypothetical protein NNO_1672 [Hydrogenimonas sp.]